MSSNGSSSNIDNNSNRTELATLDAIATIFNNNTGGGYNISKTAT